MTLEELLVLYEKLINNNTANEIELLKATDGCAAEAKFHYEYEIAHLIFQLINYEEDCSLLGNLILNHEQKIAADLRIILRLYKRCLTLNKTNAALYKKFSDYLLLHYHDYPKSVEAAKQISCLIDLHEFDKALELVIQNT
jgi:hypothetical protein